jgi:phage-related protein
MEAQSQTFNGRVSTLKDNILQLEGSLTQELFSMLSTTALPMVMDWVAKLLDAAETGGITGAMQAAGEILSELIHKFLDGLPQMMETGVSLIVKVLEGFAGSGATGKIMAGVLTVIRALLNAIANHFPEILAAGVSIIGQIVTGLAQAIPTLLSMAGELILQLFNAFINADWASIGSNIVNGIKNGIAGLWGSLVDDVQNSVNRLWNSAKNALGISSPSKKFKYIGEMSVEGMQEGFEEGETDLTRKVTSIYSGMLQAATPAAAASTGALESSVSYNLSATGGQSMIVVPLYLDGREIARATAWSMGQQLAWEEM